MYKKLIRGVFFWNMNQQRLTIAELKPFSETLLRELTKTGEIYPAEILGQISSDDGRLKSIEKLVGNNVLRYTSEGAIKWHGRPQQCEFGIL